MRAILLLLPLIAVILGADAHSQTPRPPPTRIDQFQNWIAAHAPERGQKVCYAFTRSLRGEGGPQQRAIGTLTISHRVTGRDQIAVSVGYPYASSAVVVLTIGSQEFRSYGVAESSAFFAASIQLLAALRSGREAIVRSPQGAGHGPATDTFSVAGFSAAYEAISRECLGHTGGRTQSPPMRETQPNAAMNAPRPPTVIVPRRSRPFGCEDGLWIDQVASNGAILILSDGSVWRVDPIDTVISSIWLPVDDVLVCGSEIINVDDRERVSARRIR